MIEKTKEYLKQLELMQFEIESKQTLIDDLRESLEVKGVSFEYRPQTESHNNNVMSETITRVLTLENELQSDIIELYKKRFEVINKISQLDNIKEVRVLYYHYVQLRSWEWIAYNMRYEYHYVHRLHSEALINLSKLI